MSVGRVIFKSRILGGVQNFQGDPYLNSTTVLFDIFTCLPCNIFMTGKPTHTATMASELMFHLNMHPNHQLLTQT